MTFRSYGPGTGSRLDMARHYVTFGLRAPITRYRVASCEEAECEHNRMGFRVVCDMATPLGRERAAYLRSGIHGRAYSEHQEGRGTRVFFSFAPGTQCFAEHRVPLERHVAHVIRRGMPGRPMGGTETVDPLEWHERLGENQETLRDLQQRGW